MPPGDVTGDVCPVGSYCPEGSGQHILCPPGTYTATTQNEFCLPCTAGYFCVPGSAPDLCPNGFFCPEGTGFVWQSCPAGTYGPVPGLANITECTQCDGGFYCAWPNATNVTGPCDASYYCRSGSDSNTPTSGVTAGDADLCPAGFYCEQESADPQPCPAGTFNNATGAASVSECLICWDGYACEVPGLSTPSGMCHSGYFCVNGSTSLTPGVLTSTGGPCPAGTYCDAGSTTATPCSPGYYNPTPVQSSCLDCPAGSYCEEGAIAITDCPLGE